MKKKVLRKIREISNNIIGEKETNKIIKEEIKEILDETNPKKKRKSDK